MLDYTCRAVTRSSTDTQFLSALAGLFVVFDGPDGSGKTTQFNRFVDACAGAGLNPCTVREPGGTTTGERIRQILLDHEHAAMGVRCEMLLYMASRAQLIDERIRPALAAGRPVLADRFVSSTLAYQGTAGRLPREQILAVAGVATGGIEADLVVIFDVDEVTAARRMAGGTKRAGRTDLLEPSLFSDRMEAKGVEFHRLVRRGYTEQARGDPARHLLIDAGGSEDEVWADLLDRMRDWLAGRGG